MEVERDPEYLEWKAMRKAAGREPAEWSEWWWSTGMFGPPGRRSMDKARVALLQVEAAGGKGPGAVSTEGGSDGSAVLWQLRDAGLIRLRAGEPRIGPLQADSTITEVWDGVRLTWAGAELLDIIRDPRQWRIIKRQLAAKEVPVTQAAIEGVHAERVKRAAAPKQCSPSP